MTGQKQIAEWLRKRGWKTNRLGHWFQPKPEWNGRCAPSQEIFSLGAAFERQRLIEAGRLDAAGRRQWSNIGA